MFKSYIKKKFIDLYFDSLDAQSYVTHYILRVNSFQFSTKITSPD